MMPLIFSERTRSTGPIFFTQLNSLISEIIVNKFLAQSITTAFNIHFGMILGVVLVLVNYENTPHTNENL